MRFKPLRTTASRRTNSISTTLKFEALEPREMLALTDHVGNNDAPLIVPPIADQVAEPGIMLVVQMTATNPDGNLSELHFQLDPDDTPFRTAATPKANRPTIRTTTGFSGVFEWTPPPGTVGTFSFIVLVTDQGDPPLSDADEFKVTVGLLPIFEEQSRAVDENVPVGTFVGSPLVATDPNGGTLTFDITAGNDAGRFAIDSSSGRLRTNGPIDFEAQSSYVLTVRATATGGLSRSANVTVDVGNVPEAPIIEDQGRSISENVPVGTLLGTPLLATDPDDDLLTYSIESGNEAGLFAIDAGSGQLRTNSLIDFEARNSHTLVVRASDGQLSDTAAVTITVNNVNEAPVIDVQSRSVTENLPIGTLVGTPLVATDSDGDPLIYSVTDGNVGDAFAIDETTGQLRTAKMLDFETVSTYSLTVQVADRLTGNNPLTDSAVITVTVTDGNDPPNIESQSRTIEENSEPDTLVGAPVVATDQDAGDTLTYAIISGNVGDAFAIDQSTGQITVVAPLDFETLATYSLMVRVTDSHNESDQDVVTVNVSNVNDPPNLAPIPDQAGTVGSLLTFSLSATDQENGPLAYQVIAVLQQPAEPNNSTDIAISTGGVVSWTPTVAGEYSIRISVTDNGNPPPARADVQSVRIVVSQQAAPLIARNDDAFVAVNSTTNRLDVLANDTPAVPVGGPLNVIAASGGIFGAIIAPTGDQLAVAYSPPSGFTGDDSFTYTLSDGTTGGDVQATVTVHVVPAAAGMRITGQELAWTASEASPQFVVGVQNALGTSQPLVAWGLGLEVVPTAGATGTLKFKSILPPDSNYALFGLGVGGQILSATQNPTVFDPPTASFNNVGDFDFGPNTGKRIPAGPGLNLAVFDFVASPDASGIFNIRAFADGLLASYWVNPAGDTNPFANVLFGQQLVIGNITVSAPASGSATPSAAVPSETTSESFQALAAAFDLGLLIPSNGDFLPVAPALATPIVAAHANTSGGIDERRQVVHELATDKVFAHWTESEPSAELLPESELELDSALAIELMLELSHHHIGD